MAENDDNAVLHHTVYLRTVKAIVLDADQSLRKAGDFGKAILLDQRRAIRAAALASERGLQKKTLALVAARRLSESAKLAAGVEGEQVDAMMRSLDLLSPHRKEPGEEATKKLQLLVDFYIARLAISEMIQQGFEVGEVPDYVADAYVDFACSGMNPRAYADQVRESELIRDFLKGDNTELWKPYVEATTIAARQSLFAKPPLRNRLLGGLFPNKPDDLAPEKMELLAALDSAINSISDFDSGPGRSSSVVSKHDIGTWPNGVDRTSSRFPKRQG